MRYKPPSEQNGTPRLEWPEEAYGDEREVFYAELLRRLGPAEWVAVIPSPAPLGAIRSAIEADCNSVLQSLEMPYDGVAWLSPWSIIAEALSGLFHARRPELVFLAFDRRPDVEAVTAALKSADASPAKRLLLFDEGELVETRRTSSD